VEIAKEGRAAQDRSGPAPRRTTKLNPLAETPRFHHPSGRRGGRMPLAARAQQADRMRRIGVLQAINESDPQAKLRTMFEKGR
jgi:hypothetical protein